MGCNFYLRLPKPRPIEDFPTLEGQHIGKRSAAGLYCWDCGIVLAWTSGTRWGQDAMHYGADNFEACPLCGQRPAVETLESSAAGRELGFNRQPPGRRAGVMSTASFTFAWYPVDFRAQILKHGVVDEYGGEMTGEAFLEHLAKDCPLRFWYSVGKNFS